MRVSIGLFITASTLVLTNCATSQNNPIYQQTTKYQGSVPTTTMVQQARYETQAPAMVSYANTPSPYGQTQPYTRTNHECLSKESNRKLIGGAAGGVLGAVVGRKLAGGNKTVGTLAGAALGGAAGFGIADKTIRCDPITVQPANTVQAYQPVQRNVTMYPASATIVSAPTQISETVQAPAYGSTNIEENTNSFGENGTPGYYAIHGIEAPQDMAPTQTALQEQYAFEDAHSVQHTETTPTQPFEVAPASLNTRHHTIIPGDTVYSLARSSCISVAALKSANGIDDSFYIRAGDEIMIPLSKCVE